MPVRVSYFRAAKAGGAAGNVAAPSCVESRVRTPPPGVIARVSPEDPVAVKFRPQTSETEDLVRLYLDDVGRHDLLTKDDEVRLAQAIEAGEAARETLAAAKSALTRAEKREL